jgi:phosphohistidine swiveling domain-containing protein
MKININPKKELFRWGPIDGRLIYLDYFGIAFTHYGKRFVRWPDMLGLLKNEKVTYILDNSSIYVQGEKNFHKYILKDAQFQKYYREWQTALKGFKKFNSHTLKADLKKLDNNKIVKLFENWSEKYFTFWTIGELPEISNWGGEEILKKLLQKLILPEYFNLVFEKLSAPELPSFYQKAELELLKLKHFRGTRLKKQLNVHQQNHYWMLNSYQHTRILNVSYFKKQLDNYNTVSAIQKIQELKNYGKTVKRQKLSLITKYRLDNQTTKIAKRLSFCIWWQDLRKFYIFLANHTIDVFLKEFARRFRVSFDELHDYNYKEIINLIKHNKKFPKNALVPRIFYYNSKNNTLSYVSGKFADRTIKKFSYNPVNNKTKILKGLVVSQGPIVKARVKIIHSPREVNKIRLGEILVAPMTSPDFIVAMKKASAIITDTGGMTSHAAIVSRELGISCIVGTKIATQILKDGDRVEVDTNKGTVKKL